MPSFKPVTAVLRAFDVLAAINRLETPSFTNIHRASGLSSATVVRILETLEHAGLIARDRDRGVYLPTSKTLALSAGYDLKRNVSVEVAATIADLQRQLGWPSDLAVFENDHMVVVETSRGQGKLFFNRKPGFRAPMLATSLGLAYLAFSEVSEQKRILSLLADDPAPWNDAARDRALAGSLFETIRKQGYATMHPAYSSIAYDSMVSTIGVPLLVAGKPVAALNLSFLTETMSVEMATMRNLEQLQAAANAMAGTWTAA